MTTWEVIFSVAGILVGILLILAGIIFHIKPWPEKKKTEAIWHQLPSLRENVTPCCGVDPRQLPEGDMLTVDLAKVNCPALAQQPQTFRARHP